MSKKILLCSTSTTHMGGNPTGMKFFMFSINLLSHFAQSLCLQDCVSICASQLTFFILQSIQLRSFTTLFTFYIIFQSSTNFRCMDSWGKILLFSCLVQHVIPFWQFFFFAGNHLLHELHILTISYLFFLLQLAEPYYAFKAAGFEVTIASTAGGAIPIDAGSMKGDAFTAGKYSKRRRSKCTCNYR